MNPIKHLIIILFASTLLLPSCGSNDEDYLIGSWKAKEKDIKRIIGDDDMTFADNGSIVDLGGQEMAKYVILDKGTLTIQGIKRNVTRSYRFSFPDESKKVLLLVDADMNTYTLYRVTQER